MQHTDRARDSAGHPQPSDESPLSHPLLISEKLHLNAGKNLVKVEKTYKTSETDATPVVYTQRVIPVDSDETATQSMTFFPWVKN